MIYSPRLSERASATARSFSYALGQPMTKTIEKALSLLPLIVHPVLVCQKCRDASRCALCAFNLPSMPEEIQKLLPPQP